jgi:8-oxo-dGTP pyrophosphatase MutT (NUDIX family)
VRWKVAESELLVRTPIFSLRRERKHRVAEPGSSHDFYLLDAVDWVNVVPVTPEGEIVFIELYRHGIEASSLEIPGGMIDPEDPDPAAAGARELREETGYAAERLLPLGVVHPNPAIQANRCHTFLAENAKRVSDPLPDATEDIRVVLHRSSDVPRLLDEGTISHALVVAGLFRYLQSESRSGKG